MPVAYSFACRHCPGASPADHNADGAPYGISTPAEQTCIDIAARAARPGRSLISSFLLSHHLSKFSPHRKKPQIYFPGRISACDRGTKKNAKGYKMSWNGYKLHLDTNDIGLPISALVTSASLHGSQVAIPLIKLTSRKVTYCYDLMDAAYDANRIDQVSRSSGHVPIIDKNKRGMRCYLWLLMKRSAIKFAPVQSEQMVG